MPQRGAGRGLLELRAMLFLPGPRGSCGQQLGGLELRRSSLSCRHLARAPFKPLGAPPAGPAPRAPTLPSKEPSQRQGFVPKGERRLEACLLCASLLSWASLSNFEGRAQTAAGQLLGDGLPPTPGPSHTGLHCLPPRSPPTAAYRPGLPLRCLQPTHALTLAPLPLPVLLSPTATPALLPSSTFPAPQGSRPGTGEWVGTAR